jgi:hypothetical protein
MIQAASFGGLFFCEADAPGLFEFCATGSFVLGTQSAKENPSRVPIWERLVTR